MRNGIWDPGNTMQMVSRYKYSSFWIKKSQRTVVTFSEASQRYLESITNYTYNNNNLQIASEVSKNSKKEDVIIKYDYVQDAIGAPYDQMKMQNQGSIPLQSKTYINDENNLLRTKQTTYFNPPSSSFAVKNIISSSVLGNPVEAELEYQLYDAAGNVR